MDRIPSNIDERKGFENIEGSSQPSSSEARDAFRRGLYIESRRIGEGRENSEVKRVNQLAQQLASLDKPSKPALEEFPGDQSRLDRVTNLFESMEIQDFPTQLQIAKGTVERSSGEERRYFQNIVEDIESLYEHHQEKYQTLLTYRQSLKKTIKDFNNVRDNVKELLHPLIAQTIRNPGYRSLLSHLQKMGTEINSAISTYDQEIRLVNRSLKDMEHRHNSRAHDYFFKEQMIPYTPDVNHKLIISSQKMKCGPTCVQMLLSDENSHFQTAEKADSILQSYEYFSPNGGTRANENADALNRLGNRKSYTYKDSLSRQDVLRQPKDSNGDSLPMIAGLHRSDRPDYPLHAIVIDETKKMGGDYIIGVRDPGYHETYSIHLDDFLEVWTGELIRG
ncbi:hypothetical protein [Dictyobacter arantiisoli]|uniref:Uncharacterized protein n=1 Tax=Dictyobacter arantiisoli TaxID=2014874 RepID=A0A5A5THG3_9CHLR|nr:hypothetical protein [Dictyobacter arantiisoli]GCF10648.1 hypothetical protein KDI_42120 [Dictyobacter arantiisoli]